MILELRNPNFWLEYVPTSSYYKNLLGEDVVENKWNVYLCGNTIEKVFLYTSEYCGVDDIKYWIK